MIITTRIEVKGFFELTSRQCALLAANWNIVEVFLTKIRTKCEIRLWNCNFGEKQLRF